MSGATDPLDNGTVTFLPHRLNRQPVIVRGLTADELWVTVGLSACASLLLGIPLAWLTRSLAVAPTLIVVGVAAGVFIGGGVLRRRKRGRPDTWLYRHVQWWLRCSAPRLSAVLGGRDLITRAGYWTTRRTILMTTRRGRS
ncbi:TIGR03750 family conjugal transfer protein [Paraburkholderia ginsengisoli]|uniref:TIGR03750 family conjugal transfer protein n=1 Tax=Paraburkholderia ginsengisoli TaxID=311231 RepID=A0A7T4N317_9BURK|nr:TIGR03750 family conjugal transfer protein [Paraburkholderia ginsengisoli]QQC64348.1 TIGR03750 family conjugal transfer protein [Paraburkholderia ginsengisoli]